MNFSPDSAEARYRDQFRKLAETYDWPAMRIIRDEIKSLDAERYSVNFYRALSENGLVGLTWRKPYGADASAAQAFLFMEELETQGFPGYGLVQNEAAGNLIMKNASQTIIDLHMPHILDGSWRYCAGLSEPEAGSDLLSLKTKAVRDGDHYVINGSKLWTSAAHIAQWCTVLVRTDPNESRTRGLTVLLVDMQSPGIEVRPVRVMGGWRVNAVFFDNVHVPVESRIGAENQGWKVLTSRLDKERAMSFGGTETRLFATRLMHRLSGQADSLDEAQLQALGQFITDCEVDRLVNMHVSLMTGRGEDTSGVAAMSKVAGSELAQRFAQWAADVVRCDALYGEEEQKDALLADIEEELRIATVLTVIGGTSEIQRNLVAGRTLELPKSN